MKKYQFSVKKFRPSLLFSCVLAFLFSAGAMVIVATDFGKKVPRFAQYIVFVAAALFSDACCMGYDCFLQNHISGKARERACAQSGFYRKTGRQLRLSHSDLYVSFAWDEYPVCVGKGCSRLVLHFMVADYAVCLLSYFVRRKVCSAQGQPKTGQDG